MAIQFIDGPVIDAGQSLSSVADCRAGEIVRLTMPAAWDAVPLTFQISSDGMFFNDVFTHDGQEVEVAVTPGCAVIVPVGFLAAAAFIKFRSGTRSNPVPQSAGRLFAISLKVPDVVEEPPPAEDPPVINIKLVR